MCSHNCDRCVARGSNTPGAASCLFVGWFVVVVVFFVVVVVVVFVFLSRLTICAAITVTAVLPGVATYPEQLVFYLDLRWVQPWL